MAEIRCSKCGAPVTAEAGDRFVTCGYCGARLYVDRSGAGFFYIMPFLIARDGAEGIFRRWASGPEVAKDIGARSRVTGLCRVYFPVYMFKRDVDGSEKVLVEPARASALPGMHSLKVPAGDLKTYDKSFETGDAELLSPDLDMIAYLPGLPGKPKEQALVYLPMWKVEYEYAEKKYEAFIDGSSGQVFASAYKRRSQVPYIGIALVLFVVFVAEGMLGYFTDTICCCLAPVAITAGLAVLAVDYLLRRL